MSTKSQPQAACMSAQLITLAPRHWTDDYGYVHHRMWLELGKPVVLCKSGIVFQIMREWKIGWLKLSRDVRLVGIVTVPTLGGRKVEQHDLTHDVHINLSRWLELMIVLRAQQCDAEGVPTRAFVEFVSTNPEARRA